MLTSGLHGTVAGFGEGTVDIEIAPGVVATFARPAVMEVRTPTAPCWTPRPRGRPPAGRALRSVDGDGDPTDRKA